MDEAYEYWRSLCSVLDWIDKPDCKFSYPAGGPPAPAPRPGPGLQPVSAPTAPAAPPPPPPAPAGPAPASCKGYREATIGCARKVPRPSRSP